jgi:class 3 adenylate cyclase/putative methionine-R-sulfoxide reductase with GAF domain
MAGAVSGDADLARQLDDLRAQQSAISGVLRAVAQAAGLEPVLEEVVEACRRLCDADYGALWLLEHELLYLAVHHGSSEGAEYDRQHPHALDRTTAAGRAALERKPVHIPDVQEDPEYVYAGPRFYRAMLGVPILVEDDLIGVVVLVRREPEPFTADHIALVETFADQAAIAITKRTPLRRRRAATHGAGSVRLAAGGGAHLEHRRRAASRRAPRVHHILFCDLRGFTVFAETAAPEELFDVLREYHGALGELIPHYEGTLEHFAGDGVMVFFNDPLPVEGHELQAVRLALAAQERFEQLAQAWRKRGTELGLGIGIEAGYATLGRTGFEGRYDYGVLGPVANLASRLSTQAAAGQILTGQRVFAAVEETVETAPAGDLELKGFGRPIAAYEVRGLR